MSYRPHAFYTALDAFVNTLDRIGFCIDVPGSNCPLFDTMIIPDGTMVRFAHPYDYKVVRRFWMSIRHLSFIATVGALGGRETRTTTPEGLLYTFTFRRMLPRNSQDHLSSARVHDNQRGTDIIRL